MMFDGIQRDDRCDRCAELMTVRTMSYFTEESICQRCLDAEHRLIARLRLRGIDVATLAGSGQLPPEDTDDMERPGFEGTALHA